jgi:adenylate cyclase|tara:strand:- start:2874 stop:4634 length:1761 start_codon:yes stop_codon:yes gene_type:complete
MKKWISLLSIPILCIPLLFNWQALEILKLKTFDALVQIPEPSGNFVTLDITEEDVERMGGWPFPRQDLARIHLDIMEAGAWGVGWVISFPQQDRFGGDKAFANILAGTPSVLAMFENDSNNYPPTTGTVILGDGVPVQGIAARGVVENTYELAQASSQGLAAARPDVDQLVRRMPLLLQTPDGWTPSFGIEVMKIISGSDTYIIKGQEGGIVELTLPNYAEIPVDEIGRRWITWSDTAKTTLQELDVKDKFVFVGVSAKGIMPQIATPVGLLYPHEVQAAVAESLTVDVPQIPGASLLYELLILVGCLLLLTVIVRSLPVVSSIVGVVGMYVLSGAAAVWFARNNILIDFSYSMVSMTLISVQEFWLRFGEQYKLRQQIKKQFEHYLDPRQVARLQNNPELLKLGGERRTCTFLFTDVRGFTNLSEKLEPEEVTEIMNRVLTEQVECIQAHGGMVDKFIGDACMAIFNSPLDLDEHEQRAVACAQDIRTGIAMMQKELSEPIAIGIGVNTGPAVVGNMGSDNRFDYSAIGDAVNTAARLESATKEAGVDILIGESTYKKLPPGVEASFVREIKVKGKAKALKVYTI